MSPILNIRTYGDPVLREPARPVAAITRDIPQQLQQFLRGGIASQASIEYHG